MLILFPLTKYFKRLIKVIISSCTLQLWSDGMSALMTILVYSIPALPVGIYLPLCYFLSCGNTNVCGYVVNQTRELVQHLKIFSLSDHFSSSKTANRCCVTCHQWGRVVGVGRNGWNSKNGCCYKGSVSWHCALAGICWRFFSWLLPAFIGIKSYLDRNVCKVS